MSVVGNRQLNAPGRAVGRSAAALISVAALAAVLVIGRGTAQAAIVDTVPLGTSAGYVVLGASTVTNTGDSTLYGSLGVSPGTAITGFPPGLVFAPGTQHAADEAADQAQTDLTAAYLNAKNRSVNGTTTADLAGRTLTAGVWMGPAKSALLLNGTVTLDAENNSEAVFIIQTDSTLTTGSASNVLLVNGAKECNVFWQIGSSATLGTYSNFTGTILALTAVTVTTGVTVHGRAMATTAAVTLDTNNFVLPTCTPTGGTTTTTSGGGGGTTTTTPGGSSVTTTPTGGSTVTTNPGGGDVTITGPEGDLTTFRRPSGPTLSPSTGPGVPGVVGAPRTGATPLPADGSPWLVLTVALGGVAALRMTRARRRSKDASPPVAR
ncbi:MAG: hypothetical protein QOG82_2710 [Actinomycetota bacterium]|jgi:hypothetical protein|nr:hypothetical protein [Actinomycetota bacterium]